MTRFRCGQIEDLRLKWAAITKARRFRDGFLLFQGPHVVNWLPDAAADADTMRATTELLRLKVKDFHDA